MYSFSLYDMGTIYQQGPECGPANNVLDALTERFANGAGPGGMVNGRGQKGRIGLDMR